jgi:hypothetical protein
MNKHSAPAVKLFTWKGIYASMKRIALYLSTTILLIGTAFSQTTQQPPKAAIEGTVTRAGTGQPLKGARVTLNRATLPTRAAAAGELNAANGANRLGVLLAAASVSVITDANGRFTITGVDPGDYRISAEREGFIRSEYGQRTPTGSGIIVKLAANQRFSTAIQMVQASVISGRVITMDGDPSPNTPVQAYAYRYSNGQRTLDPVANTQTNDLGEYRLFGLEPGEYFVSVTSPELADQTPVGTVDVSQRGGANVPGRGGADVVQALGTIATVLGERGGPIAQALGGTSNPPVYYPGTLDPDGATSVPVGVSAETRGIDFNLRPTRAATVSGRVTAPFSLAPNQPAGGRGARGGRGGQGDLVNNLAQAFLGQSVQVNLNRIGSARTGREGLIGLRLGSAPVRADGSFEVKGVAPGTYNLTATGRDPNGQEYTAKIRVDVGSADVSNVVVALRAGVDISGKVILETAAPQDFKMTSLRVSLIAEDAALPGLLNLAGIAAAVGGGRGAGGNGLRGSGQLATETVAEDGTFTLKNVGAHEYRVRVTGLPAGAYVQSGRMGSSDALNGPFSVESAQATLQLTVGFAAGRVSGAVADPRGNAAPGAQVVLVPDEARRGRTDVYFTATSDQSGQFTLSNVPPGNYKLFAWEDIPAGAYQYPDFIRRYEDRGQLINVSPNGTITANARLIPAS